MSDRVELSQNQAEDLRKLRLGAELSQYELAERANLTRSKIKRIEKGEVQTISQEDFATLSEILVPPAQRGRPSKQKRSNGATSPATASRKSRRGGPLPKDARVQAEVKRQVRASVLTVLRDIIGDSGRVLVEKHELHDVTLGQLYQIE